MDKKIKVLALNGGGYRGLFTAEVLCQLEKKLGQPITKHFDLITGTSIGGIIALSLAAGKTPEELVKMFKNDGEKIFSSCKSNLALNIRRMLGIFRPIYKNEGLKKALEKQFGALTMGELNKAYVMVPTTNIIDGQPKFFKTPHNKELDFDKDISVIDVALATSAAPVFFPMHKIEKTSGIYVDGGLVGNAPGLFGYVEAMSYLGANSAEDVQVLAIGTLGGKPSLGTKVEKTSLVKSVLSKLKLHVHLGVNLFYWLSPLKPRLLEFVFSQNEQQVNNILTLLLKENYYLIDSPLTEEVSGDIALDDPRETAQTVLLNKASQLTQEFSKTNFFQKLKLKEESK